MFKRPFTIVSLCLNWVGSSRHFQEGKGPYLGTVNVRSQLYWLQLCHSWGNSAQLILFTHYLVSEQNSESAANSLHINTGNRANTLSTSVIIQMAIIGARGIRGGGWHTNPCLASYLHLQQPQPKIFAHDHTVKIFKDCVKVNICPAPPRQLWLPRLPHPQNIKWNKTVSCAQCAPVQWLPAVAVKGWIIKW